jgi:histidinol-phosphatase (PHP family)
VFDVLGHLDVVKRYTLRYFGNYDISPFADLIDDILRACLAADLIPEINTSSLRQGLTETMPSAATIRRYAELGGKAISFGSDSHRAEDIAAGFDTATTMLRNAGLEGLAVFKNRLRTIEPA